MYKHLFLALAAFAPFALFGKKISSKNFQQPFPSKEQPSPSIESTDNFDLSAEFLFWRADVDGAALAITENFSSSATATIVDKRVIDLDGKWEPGCRIAAGYHFGFFDQWDFLGTWTYYHGRSKNELRTVPADLSGGFLRQEWSGFLGPIVTSAAGHWSLNLNFADLELQRTYGITSKISMRPHVGVRGAWVDLNYLARYTGVWNVLLDITNPGEDADFSKNTAFKGSSDFGGGGLVGGSGLRWNFNDTWAFWGNFTASLLYGQFSVKERFDGGDYGDPVVFPNSATFIDLTEKYRDYFNRIGVTMDFLFGLEARKKFNKDRSRITVFLGYELLKLFRFNELFLINRSFDTRPLIFFEVDMDPDDTVVAVSADDAQFERISFDKDIGFQGITAKLEFEF